VLVRSIARRSGEPFRLVVRVNGPADRLQPALYAVKINWGRRFVGDPREWGLCACNTIADWHSAMVLTSFPH
jgi:hypothetical protein